jgi:hypothetical protein
MELLYKNHPVHQCPLGTSLVLLHATHFLVLVPCKLALFFMMIVNCTEYKNRTALYNGFAAGAYVAMASEARLPLIVAFAIAGTFAGLWGLLLSPFFLDFGRNDGFTAMMGYSTYYFLSKLFHRFLKNRYKMIRMHATTSNGL